MVWFRVKNGRFLRVVNEPAEPNKEGPAHCHRQEVKPSAPSVKRRSGAAHAPDSENTGADYQRAYSCPESPEGLLCAFKCQDHILIEMPNRGVFLRVVSDPAKRNET